MQISCAFFGLGIVLLLQIQVAFTSILTTPEDSKDNSDGHIVRFQPWVWKTNLTVRGYAELYHTGAGLGLVHVLDTDGALGNDDEPPDLPFLQTPLALVLHDEAHCDYQKQYCDTRVKGHILLEGYDMHAYLAYDPHSMMEHSHSPLMMSMDWDQREWYFKGDGQLAFESLPDMAFYDCPNADTGLYKIPHTIFLAQPNGVPGGCSPINISYGFPPPPPLSPTITPTQGPIATMLKVTNQFR